MYSICRRGLTPPHRVKSISMATFTTDEVEFIQNRGNDYCLRTWLGLYEGAMSKNATRDEQQVHCHMVDTYEKRRHYLEPQTNNLMNGSILSRPSSRPVDSPKSHQQTNNNSSTKNTSITMARPVVSNVNQQANFVANFESADIFNATNINSVSSKNSRGHSGSNNNFSVQMSFANFDNNPAFSDNSKH